MIFFSPFSQLAITFRKALDISITAAQPIFEEANHFQNITSFIYTDNAMIVAILVLYTSMTARARAHKCKLEDDINISVHSFPLTIINGIIAPSGTNIVLLQYFFLDIQFQSFKL